MPGFPDPTPLCLHEIWCMKVILLLILSPWSWPGLNCMLGIVLRNHVTNLTSLADLKFSTLAAFLGEESTLGRSKMKGYLFCRFRALHSWHEDLPGGRGVLEQSRGTSPFRALGTAWAGLAHLTLWCSPRCMDAPVLAWSRPILAPL